MKPTVNIFKDKDTMAKRLAVDIKEYILRLAEEKDLIYIALSGGSTPSLLFAQMREIGKDLPWERIRIFWVDERCVPPDHDESNFGRAKEEFLSPLAIPESSVFRIRGEEDPLLEARRYSELILDIVSPGMMFPVFDLLLLGMGSDGHTASIFPHQIELWNAEELCTVGTHLSGQNRVSFTGHLINAAQKVIFMVAGKEKARVVYELFHTGKEKDNYPSSLVAPHHGELEWYLDSDAAEKIK